MGLGVAVAVGAAREVLRPPLGEGRVLGDALFDQGPHLRQLFGHVRQAHPDRGARRSAIEQSGRGAAAGGERGVDLAAERGQRRDALAIHGGVAAPGDLGGERHAPELRGGRHLIAGAQHRALGADGRRAPRRRAPRRASRARRGGPRRWCRPPTPGSRRCARRGGRSCARPPRRSARRARGRARRRRSGGAASVASAPPAPLGCRRRARPPRPSRYRCGPCCRARARNPPRWAAPRRRRGLRARPRSRARAPKRRVR